MAGEAESTCGLAGLAAVVAGLTLGVAGHVEEPTPAHTVVGDAYDHHSTLAGIAGQTVGRIGAGVAAVVAGQTNFAVGVWVIVVFGVADASGAIRGNVIGEEAAECGRRARAAVGGYSRATEAEVGAGSAHWVAAIVVVTG